MDMDSAARWPATGEIAMAIASIINTLTFNTDEVPARPMLDIARSSFEESFRMLVGRDDTSARSA